MHFLDELVLSVRSGNGGDGKRSFLREKSRPWGGPDGGDGGRGGSVWFEADANLNTFYPLKFKKIFAARDGEGGGALNCTGKSAPDLVVLLPVGTLVRPRGGSEILADLDAPGKRFRAAKGGKGGLGNQNFATPTNQAPQRADPGQPGEENVYDLELKLLADVGLLGLPNAGKSTFLARVSAARPKIADYPFTTLIPNLGVVAGPDYKTFVIADIPGLIEGAHAGLGLGDQFLRHVERTKILLHLVDLSPYAMQPPMAAVRTIEKELEAYTPGLLNKPRLMAGTKSDLGVDAAELARLKQYAAENGMHFFTLSAPTGEGLKPLMDTLWTGMANPASLRLEPVTPTSGAKREKKTAAEKPASAAAEKKPKKAALRKRVMPSRKAKKKKKAAPPKAPKFGLKKSPAGKVAKKAAAGKAKARKSRANKKPVRGWSR